MPAFTPVVLMDGKTTPASHTYDIMSNGAGRTKMVNRAAPNILSQENLILEVRQPNGANGSYRGIISGGSPITVTDVSGKVTVDHTSSFKLEFNSSQLSSRAERKDVLFQAISALNNAMIQEAILDLEPVYT